MIVKTKRATEHQAKTPKLGCRVSFALFLCLLSTNIALCSPWLCQTSAPFSLRPTLSSTVTCKPLFSKYRWLLELRFHIVMVLPLSIGFVIYVNVKTQFWSHRLVFLFMNHVAMDNGHGALRTLQAACIYLTARTCVQS